MKPMCMKIFIITLFIIAKYQKKLKCSKQENALINYDIAIQWIKIDNWEKYENSIKIFIIHEKKSHCNFEKVMSTIGQQEEGN